VVGDYTKTSSQGRPLDQEANAPTPDMSSAQQSMLQKIQGMIGQKFAKRMTE
jgi:hypothetical protein